MVAWSYSVILHLGWFECQSDCVSFVGLEYCVCLLHYRMPPAKSSRGRPARQQQPSERQTRSRTAAGRPATRSPARLPAALGAPPPECTVQQDFDEAPGLQAVLLDDAASVRRAWERDMERRMASSERMLHEIHAMVLALRPTPAAAVAAPAASAAAGSAAQLAAAMAHGPPVPATSGAVSDAAPWPSYLTVEGLLNVPGTNNVDRQVPPVMNVLPGDTQEVVAACSSSALPLHVRIPDRLKAKIWAGEYVDLALLLHDNFAQPQDYALSVQSAGDGQGPTLCVSPAKGKTDVLSFQQWLKAFEMFMSVYLVHPGHLPSAPHMLKYIETVRNLYERGGNWHAYDEAFRSLRQQRGWAWDSVNWELWMNASQSPARRVFPSGGSPFPGKGKARPRSASPCFIYNRGGSCRADTCRFTHKCRRCNGPHPLSRCRAPEKRYSSSSPPPPNPPAGPSSAPGPPAWSRK